jgi:hypothetical protein
VTHHHTAFTVSAKLTARRTGEVEIVQKDGKGPGRLCRSREAGSDSPNGTPLNVGGGIGTARGLLDLVEHG